MIMVNRNEEGHEQALILVDLTITIIVKLLIRCLERGDLLTRCGPDVQGRSPVPQWCPFAGQRRQVLLELIAFEDGPRLSLIGIGDGNRLVSDLKGKHRLSYSSPFRRRSRCRTNPPFKHWFAQDEQSLRSTLPVAQAF